VVLQGHLRLRGKSLPPAGPCHCKLPFFSIIGPPPFCVCQWGRFWLFGQMLQVCCLEPFVLTCSQVQQNKEISSATNELHDSPRSLPLHNYYSYSTLNTKLSLSHVPCWALKRTVALTLAGLWVPPRLLFHSPPQQEGVGRK